VDVDALRAEVHEEIEAAAAEALAGPMPSADDVLEGVFCEGDAEPLGDGRAPWSGFARDVAEHRSGLLDSSSGDVRPAAERSEAVS
jgi:hypothetical protein